MKAIGIDYGDSRIGIALSDLKKIIATPLKTIKSASMRINIDVIAALAKSEDADLIVIGLPLNMDGTEGERACKTRAFGRNLEKVSGIGVVYFDERLSSVDAKERLNEMKVKPSRQKQVLDTLAAQIILQGYLDTLKNKL